jgi:hypothetical protein
MSATADAGLFASYFETALGQPSGQLTIPGFTHPVTGKSMMRCVVRLCSLAAWERRGEIDWAPETALSVWHVSI